MLTKWLRGLARIVPLLALTLLSACGHFSTSPSSPSLRYDLATVPSDVRVCFTRLTGKPEKGSMTEAQAVALIGRLRQSEVAKTKCGRRLLSLYDEQARR